MACSANAAGTAVRSTGFPCCPPARRRYVCCTSRICTDVLGLDDAHIERHDLRVAARPPGDGEGFGLAVLHSPDPVPELVALGWNLVLSGHTHGGQVRMPLVGALVTNSQLPTRLCM